MRSFVSRSLTLVGLSMATLTACGGGGGGGGEPTPTPILPDVFYVRASGNDANDGRSAENAFRTLEKAVTQVTDGDTVIAGPGTYARLDINRKVGLPDSPIAFVADPSGTMTGDGPGAVRITIDEGVFGIRLTQSPHVIVDGFTITGATADNAAGVIVRSSSHNATVRNCELFGNTDGVLVRDSNDVTLFNNLIVDNANRGVFIGASGAGAASQNTRVISNTIVVNGGAGIFIGGNDTAASTGTVVRNNVIQDNEARNFDVSDGPPSSAEGLTADFNLVFRTGALPACAPESPQSACGYGPLALRGGNDVNADALFTAPGRREYFLDQENSPAVDTGDPELDSGLADMLRARTTSASGTVDQDPIDLGYHAPQPES